MNSHNHQGVKPVETSPFVTFAFRACKKKALKKNYGNDKLTADERANFENCILKYIGVA